jgi:hypothetical protein
MIVTDRENLFLLLSSRVQKKILLINAQFLLNEIFEKNPMAEVSLVLPSKRGGVENSFSKEKVSIYEYDFTKAPLPFAPESFDYIIADRCLEQMENAQDMALAMFFWLKEDGCLLTSFSNRKYGNVEEDSSEDALGRRQGYSLEEVENLLKISFYKEFAFGYSRSADIMGDFVSLPNGKGGLSTQVANEAAVWLVAAYRSTFETAFLKRRYTKAVRRKMACLLRRVAYEVESEESCAAFWALCEEKSVKASYVAAFIENTMVDSPAVFSSLGDWAMFHQREQAAMDLLDASLQSREALFTDEK